MPDRSPSPIRLRAVALLLLLALSAPALSAGEAGRFSQTFRVDFAAKDAFDVRDLALVGGHAEELVHAEPGGLRVTVPPNLGKPEGVGIRPRFKVRGDFEIAATFEILKADKPTEGYGIGAQMSLETETPTKEAVTAEWTYTPGKDGTRFISTRVVGKPGGGRDYRVQSLAANRKAGTLRLVRVGSTLTASYRDQGEAFERTLPAVELGPEDVDSLKLVANTGVSDHPVDIRLTSWTISADELPGWAGATTPAGGSASAAAAAGANARFWRPILVGLAALVVVGILFTLFGATREKKGAAAPASGRPAASARGVEPVAEWDEEGLAAIEARAREFAGSHPDSELFFEPGLCQFTLKGGALEGPAVVWWKVAVDELKRPGQTWDDLRKQLPKRYRGRYRDGRRDGSFQGWDSTGGTVIVRFVEGARS